LDCSGDPKARYKAIVWRGHHLPNQKWKFVPDGQGNYSIVCLENSGTVEIPDYSGGQQGAQLHVSQPNGTINEKWRIEPSKGGYVIRSAANPSFVFNVIGAQNNEGDGICVWPYAGDRGDLWTIVPA
jgi:glucosylceramidase